MSLDNRAILSGQTILIASSTANEKLSYLTSYNTAASILFTRNQRNAVIVSNIGICSVILGLRHASSLFGFSEVVKYYGILWLAVTHWCT